MSTYFELDKQLQGRCRESRKLQNNTYAKLFLDKLASLNRSQCLCSDSMKSYYSAYAEVERLARGEAANEQSESPEAIRG